MSRVQRFVGIPAHANAQNKMLENITKSINGGLDFGTLFSNPTSLQNTSNLQCWKLNVTAPGVANTEFSIAHNLFRVPIFFFYFLDRVGDLYSQYAGMTAWTPATNGTLGNIYVKCSVAGANCWVIMV